jgi:hypothetical protein
MARWRPPTSRKQACLRPRTGRAAMEKSIDRRRDVPQNHSSKRKVEAAQSQEVPNMATTRPGAYCVFPVLQSGHAMHQTSVWSRVDTPTRRRDGLQQPAYAWLVWRVRRLGGHGKAPSGPRAQMGLAVFCSQSRTTKSPNSFSTATASPGQCNRPPLLRPDLHLERACRDCCVPKLARASASLGVPRSSSRLLFNLQHPLPHPQHPRWRPSSCASTSS